MYSISYWHKKLHERLSHGYVDRTQDYLDGKIKDSAVWTGVGEAKYKMSGTHAKIGWGMSSIRLLQSKHLRPLKAMKFRPEKLADGLKNLKISTRTASAGLLTKPLSLAAFCHYGFASKDTD